MPDRGRVNLPGLLGVRNMVRTADGYSSFADTTITNTSALDAAVRGASWARTSEGLTYMVAGTEHDLFLAIGAADWVNVTPIPGFTYNLTGSDRWDFATMGIYAFASNGEHKPQFCDVGAVTPGFSGIFDSASLCSRIMVFGDFLILGNIIGFGGNISIGVQEAGIHWCEIGNPLSWPDVGTPAATNAQSDFRILEGDGGPITDMVSASTYAVIFRERQLWRLDYVGAPAVFATRKIDNHTGCTVPGSSIAVGNFVYFISEDGFKRFDGASIQPIGFEKVDRTMLSLLNKSITARARISVAHDSDRRSVMWAIPTSTNIPDLVFAYNYELGQWWSFAKSMEWLLQISPVAGSMDAAPYATADMDNVAPPNLGAVELDTIGTPDVEKLAAFLPDHMLYTFDDSKKLTGTIETGDFKLPSGSRAMIKSIRPEFKGSGTLTAALSGRVNSYDEPVYKAAKGLNSSGRIPGRAAGRYLRALITTTGDISQLQGFDPFYTEKGKR